MPKLLASLLHSHEGKLLLVVIALALPWKYCWALIRSTSWVETSTFDPSSEPDRIVPSPPATVA